MRVSTPVGISIDLEQEWFDVTDDVLGDNVPFTLEREQGSGAFQFSTGIYRSGTVPNPSPEDLGVMLLKFAATRGLGNPYEVHYEASPILLAAATFRSDIFVRVWYISDGRSFGLLTLTSNLELDPQEIADCERMARSVQFGTIEEGEQGIAPNDRSTPQ